MSSLGLITLDIRKQRAVIAMHLPSCGAQYVPQPLLYPLSLSLPHSLFSLPLPSHVSPPFGQFNLRLSAKCKVMCDCIRRVCPPALAGIVFDGKAEEGSRGSCDAGGVVSATTRVDFAATFKHSSRETIKYQLDS